MYCGISDLTIKNIWLNLFLTRSILKQRDFHILEGPTKSLGLPEPTRTWTHVAAPVDTYPMMHQKRLWGRLGKRWSATVKQATVVVVLLKTKLCIQFWCYILLSSKKEKLLKEGGSHTNGNIIYVTYFGHQAGESSIENFGTLMPWGKSDFYITIFPKI